MCVNALHGLLSFLPSPAGVHDSDKWMCQCPSRASLISTEIMTTLLGREIPCQCPSRASLISTCEIVVKPGILSRSVNALHGLLSFLQYPLESRINTGFPGSILQIFVRIF